jgi:asparagine synthase (glutamine-hydrolysing)
LGDHILSPEMRRDLAGFSPLESYLARFKKYRDLPALQQMQAVDLETYLPGDILVKFDRATMACSLEARCPYRLAALACRLPASCKLGRKEGKHIFRKVVEPYLPAAILSRRKMGFGVPIGSWFRGSL